MRAPHIARRYAKAILEIGSETGKLDALVGEMTAVAEVYASNPELRNALGNPLIAREAKRAILTELAERLGLEQIAKNVLLMLGDRRRLPVLPEIAQLLREMSDKRGGVVRAEVITAVPLSDAYYAKLQAELEKMTGNKVTLDKREDPSIIAGVITRIGDTVFDGSLSTRLLEMKANLLVSTTTDDAPRA